MRSNTQLKIVSQREGLFIVKSWSRELGKGVEECKPAKLNVNGTSKNNTISRVEIRGLIKF